MELKSLEQLESEAIELYSFVNQTIVNDPAILDQLGAEFLEKYSRSGEMMAQAKIYLNRALKIAYTKQPIDLAPSIAKELAKLDVEREQYLYDLAERINRSCLHSVEFIRSLISKNKAEMNMQNLRI